MYVYKFIEAQILSRIYPLKLAIVLVNFGWLIERMREALDLMVQKAFNEG